jgi:hypothetical protein
MAVLAKPFQLVEMITVLRTLCPCAGVMNQTR